MLPRLLMLAVLLVASGCAAPSAIAWVDWYDDAVEVQLHNLSGPVLWGLAETHPACGEQCWMGEACLSGVLQEPAAETCHPIDADGGVLDFGAAPDTLDPDWQTVFWSPDYEDAVTHVIVDEDSGDCWTFGHDPATFVEAGCTILEDGDG